MAMVTSGAIFRSPKQDLNHGFSIIELRKSQGQFVAGVQWGVGRRSDAAEAEDWMTTLWGLVLGAGSGLVPRTEY